MHHKFLLDKHPLVSDQLERPAMTTVLKELELVLQTSVEGDITEFGCYIGTTGLFIRRLLNHYESEKIYYAYDSFEGLPEKTVHDGNAAGIDFKGGELAVSKKQLLQAFQRAGLQPPRAYKAWFKDLQLHQLPATISFAFLDGDFYESIIDSLRLVWPRMASGGTITIDDYQKETLPGVERAVADFFKDKPVAIRVEHNIAVIRIA